MLWFLLLLGAVIGWLWWKRKQRVHNLLYEAHTLHHQQPPRARSALRRYREAAHHGYVQAYLPMAQILQHGLPDGPEPVAPNWQGAQDAYLQAALWGDAREQAKAEEHVAAGRVMFLRRERLQEIPVVRRDVRLEVTLQPQHPREGPVVPQIQSDSQNVHDTALVRHLKKSVEALDSPRTDMGESLKSLRRFVTTFDEPTRKNALGTIDQMEANALPVTALGMTEAQVLHKVWHAAADVPSNETEAALRKDMLVQRLAEGFEEGTCTSGRVARVVDALSTFDERVQLKPEWAMRQEMLDKAAKLAAEMEPEPENMKEALYNTFKKDYVDAGLMTDKALKAELEGWGDL